MVTGDRRFSTVSSWLRRRTKPNPHPPSVYPDEMVSRRIFSHKKWRFGRSACCFCVAFFGGRLLHTDGCVVGSAAVAVAAAVRHGVWQNTFTDRFWQLSDMSDILVIWCVKMDPTPGREKAWSQCPAKNWKAASSKKKEDIPVLWVVSFPSPGGWWVALGHG